MVEPRYGNRCPSCVFLGQLREFDIYQCGLGYYYRAPGTFDWARPSMVAEFASSGLKVINTPRPTYAELCAREVEGW